MFTTQTIFNKGLYSKVCCIGLLRLLTYIYTNSSSHVFTNPESMRQNSLNDFVDSQIQDSWIFMDVNRYHLVRDIKPPATLILISPNFSQLEQLKKKTNFLLVQNMFFLSFGPMKSLFSFLKSQTEKNSWKKLGKTRLVVWCHKQDIRSQIFSK